MGFDEYFMSMAYLVAMKSKDPKTRIGAVIVGVDNEVVSVGYNGLCRGVDDNVLERNERPTKYAFYEHGERNSIYNAARIGVSTKGCRMYTQGIPCCDCGRGVIQAGITEVIVHRQWNNLNATKWIESSNHSKEMFLEAGVTLRYYDGFLIENIIGLNDGNIIKDLNNI